MTGFWLVTFVTHHSRISETGVVYHAPRQEPRIFTSTEQVTITGLLLDACQRYHVPVVAINVLHDHVHLVTAGLSDALLTHRIGQVKGYAAHTFHQVIGGSSGQSLWARGFHRRAIPSETALTDAINYVHNNHLKHAERWGEQLVQTYEQSLAALIMPACLSIEEALTLPIEDVPALE